MSPLEKKGKRLELLKLTSSEKGPEELGNRISKEETVPTRRELGVLRKPTLESAAAAKMKDFSFLTRREKHGRSLPFSPSSSVPGALLLVEANREPSGTAWLRRNVVVDSQSCHHKAWHKRAV